MSAVIAEREGYELMNSVINQVECRLLSLPGGQIRKYGEESKDFPTFHHFTPGLYCRELHMPRGAIVTSYVHRFESPYIVSQGACYVYSDSPEWVRIAAPCFGITKARTRRMLVIESDTIWTTFHTTDETDIEKLERIIFDVPPNPILSEVLV